MKTCCDAECAGVNSCRIGGFQCVECHQWFCACEIDEYGRCPECSDSDEEEE